MENKRDRVGYIDTAAGIMILWLLCYHALWPMYELEVLSVVPWFFYFMPWFFYKSGFFFSQKPLKESIVKDTRKLLKQYVLWSIIGYAIYVILLIFFHDGLSFRELVITSIRELLFVGAVPVNRSLWFLPVLFVVHIFALLLCKRGNALLVGLGSMAVAIGLHYLPVAIMPRPIYATAWGLCFYSFGIWMQKYERDKYVIIASIIVLVYALFFSEIPSWYDRATTLPWYWYVGWYPASIAGCVVLNTICRWLDELSSRMHTRTRVSFLQCLKWVGKHSMIFYVIQGIIYVIVCDWLSYMHPEWYSTWLGFVLFLVAYVITIVPTCLIMDVLKEKRSSY